MANRYFETAEHALEDIRLSRLVRSLRGHAKDRVVAERNAHRAKHAKYRYPLSKG